MITPKGTKRRGNSNVSKVFAGEYLLYLIYCMIFTADFTCKFLHAVRTSHCRFQSTLEKILKQHVVCERGGTVLVDELLDTLKNYSDFKAVERKTLLTEVSVVLGKKVKRRERKEPV